MKDLYARLNLSPEVSPQSIRSRLKEVTDPQLKRAAQKILLYPQRRRVYDRNHRTLQLIGELRQELDLTEASNWEEEGSTDFVSPPGSSRDAASTQDSTSSSRDRRSTNSQRSSASKSSGAGFGAGSRDSYTDATQKSASSTTGMFGSAVKWVFGMLGDLAAWLGKEAAKSRLIGGIVMFGCISVIVGMCNAIDRAMEPDPQVQTAQSPTEKSEDFDSSPETGSRTEGPPEQSTRQESFSASTKPLPGNGTWWKYTSEDLIAPLKISVSRGQHYYAKLTDAYTGEMVLAIFIRSGRTVELEVPTGRYNLRYAAGETWYGREHYFGPDTRYMKTEDTFNFEVVGRQVQGHRIELIMQQGGNLSTDLIPEEKF